MPSPEQVAAAIQTIDQLTSWLENAGLNTAAIAQFKFNALAAMYPELKEVAELAKQLIGATHPLPEVGMSATELAQLLAESLESNIKPEQVNKALVALGYQERNSEKRIWLLTEAGSFHGTTLLVTSGTNKWQGSQVKWYRSVIPILENYFEQTGSLKADEDNSHGLLKESIDSEQDNSNKGLPLSNSQSKTHSKSKKAWTVAERLKEKGIKSNPGQIGLIQSFADQYYAEHYGEQPPKLSGRRTPVSSYPGEESIEFIDKAIETVLNPKKKSDS